MIAVPILAKAGDVIGVVVLHTEAPHEFDDDVLNFLVHTASLVAGAIENAQLYEETRRRVQALTTLTQLSQALAAVTLREDLYDAVTRGARELLGADACQIYRLDTESDELVLAGSDPEGSPAPGPRPGGAGLVLDLMRRRRPRPRWAARRRARPVARGRRGRGAREPARRGEEQLGMLCCLAEGREFTDEDAELLGAVANQTASGPEEGGADRAPDRGEHRQGHVRRARRGLGRGRGGEGGRGALRSQPAASVPAHRARPRGRRRRRRRGRSSPRGWRPGCGGCIHARSSTRGTTASGRSPRSRPTRPRRSSGCGARASRSAARRGWSSA